LNNNNYVVLYIKYYTKYFYDEYNIEIACSGKWLRITHNMQYINNSSIEKWKSMRAQAHHYKN